ncbi:MAG: FtsW/RodA/SpoVE family cell cycle protein [Actinomycetota bacterium]
MNRRKAELSMLVPAGALWLFAILLGAFAVDDQVPPSFFGRAVFVIALCAVTHAAVRRLAPSADAVLLPCAIALSGIGFAMVMRLNPDLAGPQTMWLATGAGAFCLTLLVLPDHRRLEQFRYSLMLLGVALLLLPLAPLIGKEVNSARLWVQIGALNFQPAEAAKVVLAAFLAGYLASKREVMTVPTTRIGPWMLPAPRHFGPLVMAWALSLAVMVWQRDLGSSVLFLALYIITIYVATQRASYVVAGGAMFVGGVVFASAAFSHVHSRIAAWLNPWQDIDGSGFQIAQSLFALGTGGVAGEGIGRGRPDFIRFGVPTDFIFSAIGEELGLIGAVAVLMLFAVIVARGFHIALRSREPFGTLLAVGLTAIVGVQTFLIIGGVTRLIPLTGITLPFVSYGGSSIVANYVLIALLMRISAAEAGAAEPAAGQPEPHPRPDVPEEAGA